ncbi:unnamed protein product [Leptidea sinapis]|uniref:Uncharacterized protein n=1 Tax=Leptidea sinapis TaxID=189913 RepID=A0A5E4Q778_9NEOP|nr:unnamed protein product [Leptidea sinapis]
MNAVATGIMGSAILTSTGIFMWNLGDVTVEASKVSQAMYCSGWENCVGTSSCRVRKLLRFGMMQAQVRSCDIVRVSKRAQSWFSIREF